jgi:para-nitrobenzyl esterase
MQGLSFAPGASADGPQSEDCLYLNVFTPGADGKKRPVMFFVHGGAFIVGSSSSPLYDGGRLAELGDVVVVSANYRLGAFGYLCLGESGSKWGATPNVGALDQVAALHWVRKNIDRFGGDPSSVTVFGESAGGTSVLLLLAMPAASGLFHRAIAQSPGNAIGIPDAAPALDVAEQLLASLGIPNRDSEKLRDVSPEAIIKAQNSVKSRLWLGFFPVLDSETLPRRPRESFENGGGAPVPLIVGTNRDEWNLFEPPPKNPPALDADAMTASLLERGFPKKEQERIPAVVAAYRASRLDKGLPSDDGAISRAVAGDIRFRIPSIQYAEAQAKRGLPTHMYLFTHGSPAMRGALGACHALELPFVFGTLDAPLQDRFAGAGPEVDALSAAMMRSWIAFAKTGDPNYDGATVPWPLYDAHRRTTMIFDDTIRVEDAPLDAERAAWDGIV